MNKITKTYAVYGILEWVCEIAVGKSRLSVPFTGGAMTALGVTPATYSTDHPVTQAIIENSPYFRSGKIVLYESAEMSERENRIVRAEHTEPKPAPVEHVETTDKVAEEAPAVEETKKKKVVVSDQYEARDYLKENYGIAGNSLRSKQSILAAAAQVGVEFEGLN